MSVVSFHIYVWIYIEGILLTFLSEATNNKCICQKKEKQHITVGTLRMFIELSQALTIVSLTHSPYKTKLQK